MEAGCDEKLTREFKVIHNDEIRFKERSDAELFART